MMDITVLCPCPLCLSEIDSFVEHFSTAITNPTKSIDQWTVLKTKLYLERKSLESLVWADRHTVEDKIIPPLQKCHCFKSIS